MNHPIDVFCVYWLLTSDSVETLSNAAAATSYSAPLCRAGCLITALFWFCSLNGSSLCPLDLSALLPRSSLNASLHPREVHFVNGQQHESLSPRGGTLFTGQTSQAIYKHPNVLRMRPKGVRAGLRRSHLFHSSDK